MIFSWEFVGVWGWFTPRPQPQLPKLRPVGSGSRLGKRPLTPLPGDVYQPGSAAHIGSTFHCLLAPPTPPTTLSLSLSLHHWWAVKQRVTLQNEPEKPSCPGRIKGGILNRSDRTICSLLQRGVNKSASF